MLKNAWTAYIKIRFEDVSEKFTAKEAWNLIYAELNNASRGSPSSQVHSIFALSGLILALWMYRRIHDVSEEVQKYLESAIETIAAISMPDRDDVERRYRLLDWSHYKADSQTGRITTSQSGQEASHFVMGDILPVILELNYTCLAEEYCLRLKAAWRSTEDKDPFDMIALGSNAVKFANIDEQLKDLAASEIEKTDVDLNRSEIMRVEGIVGALAVTPAYEEKLNTNKLVRHRKMFYRFGFGSHAPADNADPYRLGSLSCLDAESYKTILDDNGQTMKRRLGSLSYFAGVLHSNR